MGTITNSRIVLNAQKNPYLNQATGKILVMIFHPKKSQNRKFQTLKNPLIIPVTWNPYSPPCRGPKGTKKEKKLLQNLHNNIFTHTFPYNKSQNLVLLVMASLEDTHHYQRKCEVFTLTQTCENTELTVSKNCDPLFFPLTSFYLLYGSCGPYWMRKSW